VQGHPPENEFLCEAPISHEPGVAGSRVVDATDGRPARTECRVLERRSDGTALLEVCPHSGRTNQIRVHLSHLGWPVCGDPLYLPQHTLGSAQTLEVAAAPLCLHAWQLSFHHPQTGHVLNFCADPPGW
jgi:UPF0176 protein